ncbi:glycosyltransferase family 4 protein [Colwellia sp. M166]|uniref:glycosyltransferase family 4 protein n=1 Tax=Colwellia sp. M166 TaxID=2583805 RepID=UPI00211E2506|nr:glycosyltransferase family 4 protein [Colwellia sp. M166]UUO23431.1 glycosyltransferase family 4 protein [Colwellia sp. M166]|tara:strand:- start:366 stop:1436 length:1071 start_codon:yes stop_codon:yes gene_type:complete
MTKQLKIIHIVSSLNVGGAERFVIDLGEKQLSLGNEVAILSFSSNDDPLVEIAKSKAIEVHSIERAASFFGQLKILLTLKKFDIIHIHTAYALKPLSIVMKIIGGNRCVYTRHGAAPNNSLEWQKIHQNFKPYIKAMSFVSQESAEIFKSNYPWHDIPMSVVDNGVLLPDLVSVNRVSENKLHIGSVGRLVPLKHQISLLKALSILPKEIQQLIQLHIFGDGECDQKLRAFAKDNLLEANIRFYGMVTERDQIYPTFDCLVVTSETEGLSLVIMESMAYCKPVIATSVGGNPKLVKHNENGWLVDYDDHEQLAKLLCHLSENVQQVTAFGLSAREYITKNFSLATAVNKYAEIYQK